MMSKTMKNPHYVGAKAIFDENYIPPHLLFRNKEEDALFSLLNDSITDGFSLNILFQGTQGIGKKALVNKVINDLIYRYQDSRLKKLNIDCKEKKIDEILFSLITQTKNVLNLNLKLNLLYDSNTSYLWNLFKLIYGKLKNEFMIIFNNAEYLEPRIFGKLLFLGKDVKMTTIYTINKILNPSILEVISGFDFKNKLKYFTFNQLYNILKQRISLTFPFEIDKELIQYLVDLIFEHHVPVPGKAIEILRDLYPLIQRRESLSQFEILEMCQINFETLGVMDEFNMINFISEESMLNIIFLDNLSDFFLSNPSKFYIKWSELLELYELSCEALIYDKSRAEFKQLIKMINGMGIISKAGHNGKNKGTSTRCKYQQEYFMIINPNRLKVMVDTIFSNTPV